MDSSKVQLGNNAECDVVGFGDVKIRMHDGIVRTLTGVRHVPELKKNLISLGALDSAGCRYSSRGGVLKIVRGALVIMKGIKHGGLYELQGETLISFAPETSTSVRESNGYSRKAWVFVRKHKFDAVVRNTQSRALIGTETGKLIKHVRTDSSMESCSKLVNKFCMKKGIVKHRTSASKSQQCAELMSRELLETAREKISSAGVVRRIPADALSMASYLVNRSPSTAIGYQTPKEVWSGNVADDSNFRMFNCPCYYRVSDGKLDAEARCIFHGYAQGECGDQLWCPSINSPVCSREVTFDKSPVLLARSDYGSVNTDLDGVQLEVELQPETPEVADTSVVIDTDGACSEVEPIEPTVAVAANIDKVRIRSPDRYGCNKGFALSVIKELVSDSPCGAVKGACSVGVLMKTSVMTKFKRGLDLNDICDG